MNNIHDIATTWTEAMGVQHMIIGTKHGTIHPEAQDREDQGALHIQEYIGSNRGRGVQQMGRSGLGHHTMVRDVSVCLIVWLLFLRIKSHQLLDENLNHSVVGSNTCSG